MNLFGWEIPSLALDLTILVLVLAGAFLCLSAAIGLLHFKDVPSRLHAATKPQVFGLVLICIAIALSVREWQGILVGIALVTPIILMQFATAPLSAHMVGRQAYRNGTIDESHLIKDELADARKTPPAAGG